MAEVRVGHPGGCGVEHGRVPEEHLVDLARRDLHSTPVDDFSHAAGQEHVPFLVPIADVAGPEPAIWGEHLGGRDRIVVVALHHAFAPDENLPRAAWRKCPACIVDDLDVEAEHSAD